MWLFLMSEMLFFGALFMAFSFSRALDTAAFAEAARHAEIAYGAANTAVLVTSSLTITLAVRAADAARPEGSRRGFSPRPPCSASPSSSSRASNIATTFDIISFRAAISRSDGMRPRSSGPSTGP